MIGGRRLSTARDSTRGANFLSLVSAGKVSNMAGLVDSICNIIAVFQKYAGRNRECSSMKRRQMKRLIQKEFGEILEVRRFSPNC